MADEETTRGNVLKPVRDLHPHPRGPLVLRIAEWPVSKGWRVVGAPQPSATLPERDT
jgi:hypothetical protein